MENDELIIALDDIIKNNSLDDFNDILFILENIYCSDEDFIKMFCTLSEKIVNENWVMHIEAMEEFIEENSSITAQIADSIMNYETRPGLVYAFIVSPILGKGIIDTRIKEEMKSTNPILRNGAIGALRNLCIRKKKDIAMNFIPTFLEVIDDLGVEDGKIIIQTLCFANILNIDGIEEKLSDKVELFGEVGALTYIKYYSIRDDYQPETMKKAVEILEEPNKNKQEIDYGLAALYKCDPDYVLIRIKEWIINDFNRLKSSFLPSRIRSIDPLPAIKMLEDEIDNNNPPMERIGESILEDFFKTEDEWVEWCEKNISNPDRIEVVLGSLRLILSKHMDYSNNSARDDAYDLTMRYAENCGDDFNQLTKSLNLGKDSHPGAKNRDYRFRWRWME